MEQTDLNFFNSIPWCADLLQDRDYIITPTFSREYKRSTEDSLFAETLKTPNTIQAALSLYRRPDDGAKAITEARMLLSLGSGMNGSPHALHGGLIAAVIDDAMGLLLTLNKDADGNPLTLSTVTAGLNVQYLKMVRTPQVVLVVVQLSERKGRKFYINGRIEDKQGVVLARAESLWIQIRTSKL
ncbi:thioesterase superfamily protein [Rutstroemia sp. NJR-2017a BVV2]|nr:thioesterase superfamily protein [Rutstroemia sp. NJR-2017a BVV2]